MGNVSVTAALITAFGGTLLAAVVAGAVSLIVAQRQVESKTDELIQAQLKDVLEKRLEVYPKLWMLCQTLLSDYEREGRMSEWKRNDRKHDLAWAQKLFTELVAWHAEHGVFLSQTCYAKFSSLRQALEDLIEVCKREGRDPSLEDLQRLDKIYTGDGDRPRTDQAHFGLATWMKNDFGSYKIPSMAVPPPT